MELADYLRVLRRRWWLIAVALLACLGAAAVSTALQTPKYQASTRLLVSGSSSVSGIDEIANRQLANHRAVAYAQIASTGPALQAAIKEAGVSGSPQVAANASGDSPFIVILITDTSPRRAQAVANAYVRSLPASVRELEKVPSTRAVVLSTLEAAALPSSPYSPKPARDLAIGALLGLVLGLAAALAREALDRRLRSSAEIERVTSVGVLGVVPREYPKEMVIALTRPRSRRAEAYRQVRTNLDFTGPEGVPRSIVITSAGPGEGKTTLASNLAVIASHAGKSVILVEADLRNPTLSKAFDLPNEVGLTDVLSGRKPLEEAVQRIGDETLHVLTSGPRALTPSELLGSTAMVELLEELEARYDLVIIDTPPALPVTDALLIAVNAGGTVVVTRLSHTHRNALMRTVDAVRKVNAHLVGIVGNAAVEKEERQYGYGYGYTYGYVDDTPANAEDLRPTEHIQAAGRRRPVASNGGTPAVFVPEPMPAPAAAAAPAPAPMHAVVEAPPNAPLSAPVSAPPSATVPEYPPEVVAYYRDALDRRISERAKAGLAEKSAMPDEAVSQPGDDG